MGASVTRLQGLPCGHIMVGGRGGTVIHKGQCKQDRGRCQVTALRLTKGVRELKALRHVATWPLGVALPGACRGELGQAAAGEPGRPGLGDHVRSKSPQQNGEPHPAFLCPAPRSLHGPSAPRIWVGEDRPAVCWGFTWRTRKTIAL